MTTLSYLSKHSIINERYYIIKKQFIESSDKLLIKSNLTFKPKTHKDFEKFVKPIYTFKENDKYLMVPRFWGIENIGKTIEKLGNTPDIEIEASMSPRPYQVEAVETIEKKLKEDKGTTLTVIPGFGKTFISLYLSSILKKKTLIIVHTSVLLDQWIERINQFIKEPKIGIIKGKTFDIENKTHVIAMVQTLVSKTKNFKKEDFSSFGFTIFDEVHHMSAPGFSTSFGVIASKYNLGLTATPNREDGLQDVFLNNIGSIGYQSTTRDKIFDKVDVKMINYNSNTYKEKKKWNGSPDLHKMLEQIITNKKRNHFVINIIKKIIKEEGRQILVLSTRIKHLKDMKKLLDSQLDPKYTSSLYIGGMKTEELEKSSKSNILFASYQLVSEGTDIPTLNTLIQCSPKKNVEQVVGRIMRGRTKVNPLIYDIIDNFSVYKNQSRVRSRLYKRNEYEISYHSINENELDTFNYSLLDEQTEKTPLILEEEKEEIVCEGFSIDDFD